MVKNKNNTKIITIAGGSGCGKTTIAELIKKNINKKLNVEIISMDNFYLPKEQVKDGNYDVPESLNWNEITSFLSDLVISKIPRHVPEYDFISKSIKYGRKIENPDVLIIEGIFALYNENLINKFSNINIYVDVKDDERLIRRLLRDKEHRGTSIEGTIEKWRNFVMPNHRKYIEPTKYNADFIITWNENHNKLVPILSIVNAVEFMILGKDKVNKFFVNEKDVEKEIKQQYLKSYKKQVGK